MSNGSDFEDKATRLFNRLNAVANPIKINKPKMETTAKVASPQELLKIKEEIQASDFETRKKMRNLNENLKKLETTLIDENQNRAKMDQTFTQTINRLQKNMKNVLSSVHKSFAEKEKKLEEKIQSLIKVQRKEIQTKLHQNQGLIQDMLRLQTKVQTIVEQVTTLRKSRAQLQQKIAKQFNQQIRDLKRIFQSDVRQREQKETKSILSLKSLYKTAMQRILNEQREREQNEKMLMSVVQQLVNHIIEA